MPSSSNRSFRRMRKGLAPVFFGAFLALILAGTALATHPRPGGGTPFRVPLVPAFNKCGGAATADDPAPAATNSSHVAPLAQPSCTPPVMKSTTLTMGYRRCGPGLGTPGRPLHRRHSAAVRTQAGDQEDIKVVGSATDVRCAVAVPAVCAAAGADYTGTLITQSVIRITDHSNGTPATVCANGTGTAPCAARNGLKTSPSRCRSRVPTTVAPTVRTAT